MQDTPSIIAMVRPRKAQFGFKLQLDTSTLFSVTQWLRDNLYLPSADTWWFSLNQGYQMNLYTNDSRINTLLLELTKD